MKDSETEFHFVQDCFGEFMCGTVASHVPGSHIPTFTLDPKTKDYKFSDTYPSSITSYTPLEIRFACSSSPKWRNSIELDSSIAVGFA